MSERDEQAKSGCSRRYTALIERAFVAELAPKKRRALESHLVHCQVCRRFYDRLGRVDRALEKDVPGLSSRAADRIGRAVIRDSTEANSDETPVWTRPIFAALATAAVAVVLIVVAGTKEREWNVRGGHALRFPAREPGVQIFCVGHVAAGQSASVQATIRMAPAGRAAVPTLHCRRSEVLEIAYSAPDRANLHLAVFGKADDGTSIWLAPKGPEQPALPMKQDGVDVILQTGTALSAHSSARPVELFARVYDETIRAERAMSTQPIFELRARLVIEE